MKHCTCTYGAPTKFSNQQHKIGEKSYLVWIVDLNCDSCIFGSSYCNNVNVVKYKHQLCKGTLVVKLA